MPDESSGAGGLQFYAVANTATSIVPGVSSLSFDTGFLPNGFDGQLGTSYLLGSGSFLTTGNVNNGAVDNYTFAPSTMSATAQAFVNGLASSGGRLRLVVAASDPVVAATFTGATNTAPQLLTLTTSPVPEPTAWALWLGGICLMALRPRSS